MDEKIQKIYDELNKIEKECSQEFMDYETMLKNTRDLRMKLVKLKNLSTNKIYEVRNK